MAYSETEKDSSLSLLVATGNAGKVRELTAFLAALPLRLRGLSELQDIPAVEETGTTFVENAVLKARYYAARSGLRALADDSGLEVDALGGAPGVFSARYAGPDASDMVRMTRLLDELNSTGDTNRRARFVCVIALAHPETADINWFTGTCDGTIADAPRGSGGFGYDPIFIPDGYVQTFGELSPDIKSRLSHRARALATVKDFLHAQLRQQP